MKILVVDDEKLLVKGVKFNLENEGYEVTAAYDGAAAVELAKKENFDLIVMDACRYGSFRTCPSSCSRPAARTATS